MVCESLKAADALENQGVSAEVIDPRALRPVDVETVIRSVKKTRRAVMEEDWPYYGVGAQIVDFIQRYAFDYLDAPVLRVTAEDCPMPYANEPELAALPDEGKIVNTVEKVLGPG